MQCYKTVHQHYSIIDLPLSGEFSQRGRLVFFCLGDMASGRNVHCNLMLHPSGSPSFPPRPSPSFCFSTLTSQRAAGSYTPTCFSMDFCPDDSEAAGQSQQRPALLLTPRSSEFMLKNVVALPPPSF